MTGSKRPESGTIQAASAGRPGVEFFYDPACPWTYLAFVRLREAALRTGAAISYRPVPAGWIEERIGGSLVRLAAHAHPRVADYVAKDLGDWARFCGVEIGTFGQPQVATEWVQRGAVVAIERGRIAVYADAVFRAVFSDGRDISLHGEHASHHAIGN